MKEQITRWADKIKAIFARKNQEIKEEVPLPKEQEAPLPEPFIPETKEDLIWLLRRLNPDVLTPEERTIIAGVMSFKSHSVKEIMLIKPEITFVYENDFLGPLMLDKLYQSGSAHFPVMNTKGKVVGVLHTAELNSLEIKDTDRAKKYIDKNIYYLQEDYRLDQALNTFLRTGAPFCIVVNKSGILVGLLSFRTLLESLVGTLPNDGFEKDADKDEVAKRK